MRRFCATCNIATEHTPAETAPVGVQIVEVSPATCCNDFGRCDDCRSRMHAPDVYASIVFDARGCERTVCGDCAEAYGPDGFPEGSH